MKYLKLFNNNNDFETYKNSEKYIRPNVSLVNKQVLYDQRYKNIEYLDNPDVDLNYQMYINKNFHFISTHQYRIQCKCQYISNKTDGDTNMNPIVALGKYVKTGAVIGYNIYYHNSNYIYSHSLDMGVYYSKHQPSSEVQIIDDTITGLTNEYYLTLYGNIRGYYERFCNAKIYYIKITDLTTNQIICHLIPQIDANENVKYMLDSTDNIKYYLQTLGNNYRNESGLIIYENESEA